MGVREKKPAHAKQRTVSHRQKLFWSLFCPVLYPSKNTGKWFGGCAHLPREHGGVGAKAGVELALGEQVHPDDLQRVSTPVTNP